MNIRFPSPLPFLAGTLLVLATLSGCAAVDQNISLSYAPLERPFGRQNATVVVTRLENHPATRNARGEWLVGSLNNVHGVHEADLLADRDPAEWITQALILELKQDGFSVTSATPLPADAPLAIRLRTIKASMTVNRALVSSVIKQELKFGVELMAAGTLLKAFSVTSRASQTVPFSPSPQENQAVMLQALQEALQQVMAEVRAQTDRK